MQNKHDRDLCPTNSRSSVRWPPGPIPETTPEAMGAGALATLTGRKWSLCVGRRLARHPQKAGDGAGDELPRPPPGGPPALDFRELLRFPVLTAQRRDVR